MGKGEIVRYEQFLLFPQCFQTTFTAGTQKPGLVWKSVELDRQKIGYWDRLVFQNVKKIFR